MSSIGAYRGSHGGGRDGDNCVEDQFIATCWWNVAAAPSVAAARWGQLRCGGAEGFAEEGDFLKNVLFESFFFLTRGRNVQGGL